MISRFYALHGFLGLPQDLQILADQVPGDWCLVDYLRDPVLRKSSSLEDFANKMNQFVIKERGQDRSPAVLVGYSMGGRLALHTFFSAPELWAKLILISSHFGLNSEPERSARMAIDHQWLERFTHEDFNSVLQDWNAQPVFTGGMNQKIRHKEDYDANHFRLSLDVFSLARQQCFLNQIKDSERDILYVCGGLDVRYVNLSRQILGANVAVKIISDCGHRVVDEKPKELVKSISDFMARRPQISLRPQ